MTACTNYYYYCYVPEMVPRKEEIRQRIQEYWNTIKDCIKVDSYTIDFVLSPDLKEVKVIEINHLPPAAVSFNYYFVKE